MGRFIRILVASSLAVGLFALTAPAASADPASSEAQFLALSNQLRAQHGVGPLTSNGALVSVARNWSAHMASAGTISHNPNLAADMPVSWAKIGENVGMGGSVSSIQQAFVNSPHHYENLVDPSFSQVGIGVAESGSTIYVTVDFLQPAGAPAPAAPPAPAPAPPAPPARSAPVHAASAPAPVAQPNVAAASPAPAAAPAPAVAHGQAAAAVRPAPAQAAATPGSLPRTHHAAPTTPPATTAPQPTNPATHRLSESASYLVSPAAAQTGRWAMELACALLLLSLLVAVRRNRRFITADYA